MKKVTFLMLSAINIFAITDTMIVSALEEKAYQSTALVEFNADDSIVNPVDPDNPDGNKPVYPWNPINPNHDETGTAGPLSMDFVSSIDFGVNKISNKDEIYYANPQYFWNPEKTGPDIAQPKSNYVQVSDRRGTNAGWRLTVKQENQFTAKTTTQNDVLNGAEIQLSNIQAKSSTATVAPIVNNSIKLTTGETSTVMAADQGNGAGTWVAVFGGLENFIEGGKQQLKNTGVALFVPGVIPKDAVAYQATLKWTISNLPENN